MNYLFIFALLIFFLIIYLDRSYAHKTVVKELNKLKNLKSRIKLEKFDIKCSNFTSGRKNLGFHYRKADLFFLEDAFIVAGFYKIFSLKVYRSIAVFTKDIEKFKSIFNKADEIVTPDRLNLNSTNREVYIEFGKASFTSTNVSIRLKNLSEEEKQLIKI